MRIRLHLTGAAFYFVYHSLFRFVVFIFEAFLKDLVFLAFD